MMVLGMVVSIREDCSTGEGLVGSPRAWGRVGRALRLVGRSIAYGTGGIIAQGFVTVKCHGSVMGGEGERVRNLASKKVNAELRLASCGLHVFKIRLNKHFKNKSSQKLGKLRPCNWLRLFWGCLEIGTRTVTSVKFVKPVSKNCHRKGVFGKSNAVSNLQNPGNP